jgi:hypothetical protein
LPAENIFHFHRISAETSHDLKWTPKSRPLNPIS